MSSKQFRARPPQPGGASLQPVAADRRSEARQAAAGTVRLRQPGVLACAFNGHLLDTAPTGFRARHGQLALVSGQLVDFEFTDRKGVARAVWTRIVDGEAETGFRILPQEAE